MHHWTRRHRHKRLRRSREVMGDGWEKRVFLLLKYKKDKKKERNEKNNNEIK